MTERSAKGSDRGTVPRTGMPILGIVGWKNSGKTTLAVRLIAALSARGWRIATVKHAHHDFEIDTADTDSARHRRAGASEVAIVSSARWAIVHELAEEIEPSLDEVVSWLAPADLIVVEGYKREAIPKIEVRRTAAASREPLAPGDGNVVAIAADHPVEDADLPVFGLDDIDALATFVETRMGPARKAGDANDAGANAGASSGGSK